MKIHGKVLQTKSYSKSKKIELLSEYDLLNMSEHQLFELISCNVLPKEWNKLIYTKSGSDERNENINELKKLLNNTEISDNEKKKILEKETKEKEQEYIKSSNKNINDVIDDENNDEKNSINNFPELEERTLKTYGNAFKNLISLGDKQKLIAEVEIQKIWNNVLKDSETESEKTLKWFASLKDDSKWFQYVQDTFFNEYNEVNEIKEDKDY